MNAWYDDIVLAYGEYCLESTENESGGNDNDGGNEGASNGDEGNNGDDGTDNGNDGDNSDGDKCQDKEPNGNTYCKNVDRYGGCTDKDNRWYFDKYCLKTCNRCNNGVNDDESK